MARVSKLPASVAAEFASPNDSDQAEEVLGACERMRVLISQLAILIFVAVTLAISWARGNPVTRTEEIGLAIVAGSVCWHAWHLVRERQCRIRR